ncbi:glycyl-radical enzyme activating protein [Breoghania sp.]|uniref:glycyl-radical enzyme activating protein n=1 Tax=Breoghania sp. TaxID=2065378 RepID=UPI002610E0FE|nr:glycyl-radical enzyme activating protein [Breoghania sp.]MDJ0932696.1 glycyl-radical enzyme activating protein [Breoghania sp.]
MRAGVCPTDALTVTGKKMTVQQVMLELRKDATQYRRSGGGVTLSGGEPLFQHDFARELLKACHEQGWNTAMEITGYSTRDIVRDVMPHADHALIDLKVIDPQVHQANISADNRIILENALCIASLTHTVVRVPVVPGVNDSKEAISAIGRFAKLMPGVDTMHLLPYHTYGENKYAFLGHPYPMGDIRNMKPEEAEPLVHVIEDLGLKCHVGG